LKNLWEQETKQHKQDIKNRLRLPMSEIIIGNPQLIALQLLYTHHPWVNAREIIIGNPQLVALQLLSTHHSWVNAREVIVTLNQNYQQLSIKIIVDIVNLLI
jgi:hypothetical protein